MSRSDIIIEDFRRARREDCGDDFLIFGTHRVEAVTGTISQIGAFMGEGMAYTESSAFGALIVVDDLKGQRIEPKRTRCGLVVGDGARQECVILDIQRHGSSPLMFLTVETITEEAEVESALASAFAGPDE